MNFLFTNSCCKFAGVIRIETHNILSLTHIQTETTWPIIANEATVSACRTIGETCMQSCLSAIKLGEKRITSISSNITLALCKSIISIASESLVWGCKEIHIVINISIVNKIHSLHLLTFELREESLITHTVACQSVFTKYYYYY
jgi:hypothetical protein